MAKSIPAALEDLKSGLRESLGADLILKACAEVDYVWRERTLGPVETLWMFAMQILLGTACTHAIRLLPGVTVTDGGYCQARKRIPLAVLERLLDLVASRLLEATGEAVDRWKGHRVFAVDGSTVSMPDTRGLDRAFGHPSGQAKGCSFPMAKVVALFHLGSGLLVDFCMNPVHTGEVGRIGALLHRLKPDDVLVADRGFSSYPVKHMLMAWGVHFVMRLHQSRRPPIGRGRLRHQRDERVTLSKPRRRPAWMSPDEFRALPSTMVVRIVEYRVEAAGYRSQRIRLVTSLLDADRYPASDLASLYADRWDVEICYRHLKQTLGADVLRCKSEEMVRKELLMHCIVYNLVRGLMVQAGIEQGVPPDRISLVDVMRELGSGHLDLDDLPRFAVNPRRPGRHRCRARKRRPKAYPLLTPRLVRKNRRLSRCVG